MDRGHITGGGCFADRSRATLFIEGQRFVCVAGAAVAARFGAAQTCMTLHLGSAAKGQHLAFGFSDIFSGFSLGDQDAGAQGAEGVWLTNKPNRG